MAEDPWAAFRVGAAPAQTPARDDPWAAFRTTSPAATPSVEMPEFDAMGNPTGGTTTVQVPAQVPGDGKPGMLESVARGALQGVTWGAGDELQAGIENLAAGATGGEMDFDKRLKEAQAANKAASTANPWSYGAGQVVGGIAGFLPILRIPGAAAKLGFIGGNLAKRSIAAGVSGAGMGAVQGYLGTDGDFTGPERGYGLIGGGAFGGGLGAAGPIAGQALGVGGRALAEAILPGKSIPGVSKAASSILAQDVEAAGGAAAVKGRLQELGEQAMLLDASPSFQGRAQGLAVRPEAREIITDPLTARNAGTNARLRGDLDEALGPARIPAEVEGQFAASREALEPRYGEELRRAPAFNPNALWDMVFGMQSQAKGQMSRYLQQAEDLIAPMRDVPGAGRMRVPDDSPEGLIATRKALDGLIAKVLEDPQAQKEGVTRALNSIRQAVDDQMRAIAPEVKVLDNAYSALARQSEALEQGGRILDSGKTAIRPVELEASWEAMIPAERRALATGARSEIDRQVGVRANDLEALKQVVKGDGDWNRAKLAQVFGHAEADRIFNSVDREIAFRDAFNRITQNSMTELRRTAAEGVKPRGDGPTTGDVGTIVAGATGGVPGAAMAVGARGVRAANNEIMRAADIARNKEMARLLIQNDFETNSRLVDALARQLSSGQTAKRVGAEADRLGQILLMTQGNNVRGAVPEKFQIR